MTLSQKRFVDIGQSLYIEWLKSISTANNAGLILDNPRARKALFQQYSKYAFEAAEEFVEVFRHQEDT